MIGFEISVDGRKVCTAAVGDRGVLSLMASHVRRIARDHGSGETSPGPLEEELTLEVSGLAHDADGAAVHVTWVDEPLTVGQRIAFTVVETPEADPPRRRRRDDPAVVERRKRAYYERLKREYGDA